MEYQGLSAAIRSLPRELRQPLMQNEALLNTECRGITLRLDRPLVIESGSERFYLSQNGMLCRDPNTENILTVDKTMMQEFFENICEYSVYSRQNEINNGYITISGGHRVGICGTAVTADRRITNIKHITGMYIRIARAVIGCSQVLTERVDFTGGVLLCGAPASGKTTMIRDLARRLSIDHRVALIDERNEISATVSGVAQHDIGMCDAYVGYPKHLGIVQAVRSMSPDYIICDELGDRSDEDAVLYSANSGCAMIATIHASTWESLKRRPLFTRMMRAGAFDSIVFLSGRQSVGQIAAVYRMDEVC